MSVTEATPTATAHRSDSTSARDMKMAAIHGSYRDQDPLAALLKREHARVLECLRQYDGGTGAISVARRVLRALAVPSVTSSTRRSVACRCRSRHEVSSKTALQAWCRTAHRARGTRAPTRAAATETLCRRALRSDRASWRTARLALDSRSGEPAAAGGVSLNRARVRGAFRGRARKPDAGWPSSARACYVHVMP